MNDFKISKKLFLKHRLDDVWKVISAKEALELFHPYCLQNKVILFTNLEKNAQLSLIYNSKALIQPSLFEGGPGGFSVYEAISFNKPILVSDIKVNKEIKISKRTTTKSGPHGDPEFYNAWQN